MQNARREFARLVQTESFQLDRAALLIAAEEYGSLDIDHYLSRLDRLATDFRSDLPGAADALDTSEALASFLFREGQFTGNTASYYDPRNSFLNAVLDTGKGIPITLAVVYLEVGRRLDLPLKGIGLPGHFIVAAEAEGVRLLIDPFNKGKILSEDDCGRIVEDLTGGKAIFEPSMLAGVSNSHIITRMLQNLKGIYFKSSELDKALKVIDRLLLLVPESPVEIRDRGLVSYSLKKFGTAAQELDRYLKLVPGADDRERVKQVLTEARQRHSRLN